MADATDTPADGLGSSTRPYLIRALYDWCTDNGFTPYIAVYVDGSTQVPTEYVKNHEIVLNISFSATSGLTMDNEQITFKARFGGASREVRVPISHVIAIYARENGQGMAFPMPAAGASPPPEPTRPRLAPVGVSADTADAGPVETPPAPEPPPPGGRPTLKRVK